MPQQIYGLDAFGNPVPSFPRMQAPFLYGQPTNVLDSFPSNGFPSHGFPLNVFPPNPFVPNMFFPMNMLASNAFSPNALPQSDFQMDTTFSNTLPAGNAFGNPDTFDFSTGMFQPDLVSSSTCQSTLVEAQDDSHRGPQSAGPDLNKTVISTAAADKGGDMPTPKRSSRTRRAPRPRDASPEATSSQREGSAMKKAKRS
ncbi:hypothetical protein ACG7TL_007317 [Trametes sanguinea]